MRVVVVGATGTIGKAVAKLLLTEHNVIKVASKSGDFRADITDKGSLERLFEEIGSFDALVCAAGVARFAPLSELSDEDFQLGLTQIAGMGAANVVITLKTGCYALLRSSRSRDRLYRAWIPEVESVATVGSADALLAGFLSGIEAERENEDILKLALGAAAANTKEVGAGVFEPRDVARFAGGVEVQEIAPRRAKAS